MKNRAFNIMLLLAGTFILLTAHYFQTDTDEVSIKLTSFPGKGNYNYIPEVDWYKHPSYKQNNTWNTLDYSTYKTDSTTLFDKKMITIYDVTNKTKNYLVVPVKIVWEVNTVAAADPSYTVVGMPLAVTYTRLNYFLLEPKETVKGMFQLDKPPLSLSITPSTTMVVDKKWLQGLKSALGGDKKKLQQYVTDTVAMPWNMKIREKLSIATIDDLKKNIYLNFISRQPVSYTKDNFYYNVEVENRNLSKLYINAGEKCSEKVSSIIVPSNEKKTVQISVPKNTSCDSLNPTFFIDKVWIQ